MALLDVDMLRAAMGRDSIPFSADEEAQAEFIISNVEAYISRRCSGIAFEETSVTKKLQADYYGIIELEDFPINDVTAVVDVKTAVEPNWDWDGCETIDGLYPHQTVLVTYEYGYEEVPEDLIIVATALAVRGMDNPKYVRQQTVGAISETYMAPGLTQYEDAILEAYEPVGKSLRLGPTSGKWRSRHLPTL